jgi:hypothetical protein
LVLVSPNRKTALPSCSNAWAQVESDDVKTTLRLAERGHAALAIDLAGKLSYFYGLLKVR